MEFMRIKLFLICLLALSAVSLAYGAIYQVDSDSGWNEWTGVSQYPAVRLSDGNVIVYFVDSTGDLYARKSTNTGLSAWTDRVKICGNGGLMQSDTAFTHFNALVMPTRDRSSFYIFVWSYSDTSSYTDYLRIAKVDPANWNNTNGYKGVENTGAHYDVIKTLSNLESYAQLVPSGLAVDSIGQPHVTYSYTSTNDWSTNSNMYYRYFDADTGTWSSETTLTTEAGYSGGPLSIDSTDGLGIVRGKGRTSNIAVKFSWCDDASTGSCTNTNNWKTTPQGSTTGWGNITVLSMHDVLDIAVDRNNRFFVVVDNENQGNNNLFYMWNGTGWDYKGASTAYGHIGAMADSDGVAGIYTNDINFVATLEVDDTLSNYVVYDNYAARTAGSEKYPLSSSSNRYFFFRADYSPDLYVVSEPQTAGANQWWDIPPATPPTLYKESYNSELSTDGIKPGRSTFITVLPDSVVGTFTDINSWQDWYIPLGVTVNQTTDFYSEFRLLSPADFTASAGTAHVFFGLIDSGTTQTFPGLKNVLGARFDSSVAGVSALNTDLYDSAGSLQSAGVGAVILQPQTEYLVTISYDASALSLVINVFTLSKTPLGSVTLPLSQGTTFTADAVAIFGSHTGASTSGFNNPWTLYSAKANSGTTEYGQTIVMENHDSNTIRFDTSNTPGAITTDPTQVSQTGAKTVYIKSVSDSLAVVSSVDVDFDAEPSNDILLPAVAVGTDAVAGKAFMHPDLEWPAYVTNSYVYVPILSGKSITDIYRCPDATQISEISESCTNKEISPADRTEVTIDGVQYGRIHNQGGGNGGTEESAPEFSDIAYVLAAVLGAGSFGLIRRIKK